MTSLQPSVPGIWSLRIISPACSTSAIRISSSRLPAAEVSTPPRRNDVATASRLENWIDDAEGARLVPL